MIGLLTFHKVTNYGAVLQAYALQTVIKQLGYESEYVDFTYNPSNGCSSASQKNHFTKLKKLKHPFKLLYSRKKFKRFDTFCKENIRISKKTYYGDKSMTDCFGYDSFIVGSDQVWNFDITNNSTSYLLDFVKDDIPKNSYATSIGKDSLTEEEKLIFKKNLNRFDNISVREEKAAEILRQILNKKIHTCLDPTLLLDSDVWSKMAKYPKYTKYVLIYAMAETQGLIKRAKEIAKRNNLKIIAIGLNKKYKGIKNIYCASPEEWLGFFKSAETIVTNSFHGTAFSLNFNKSVYIEYLPDGWKVNSRLENIVNDFNLNSRILCKNDKIDENSLNYNEINELMTIKRNASLEYLKRICIYNEQN